RPIESEMLSSWLLRVSAANHVALRELLQGLEFRYGPLLTNVPIDYALPEDAIAALSRFCRVAQKAIRMLDIHRRLPYLKPALLLRFSNAHPICARYTLHRIRYAFCPLCIASQRVIHVRWDWSIACLIRCALHRTPLLDGCPVCGEADPLTFAAGLELLPSPLCRSCGNDLSASADSPKSIQQESEIQTVEDAYREALLGIAPRLMRKATDRAFRQFVEDVLYLLTRSLNASSTSRTVTAPFSRQDILQIIAALIANAAPGSDAATQRKRYARGLHLWATLLSIIPEHEGRTLEQASALCPLALRRRFLSALYYRIRKRWPFPPYRPAKYLGRPVERIEVAFVYGLSTNSANPLQSSSVPIHRPPAFPSETNG
ncbi:MAG: TniQ family protein, partial [Acidobacteriaceae bacterium]|nr:TniQ family protein [Acidobacteriaceae bacterium]